MTFYVSPHALRRDLESFAAAFGGRESVKAASDLISPVSGEVIEINEQLEDEPEAINADPYGAWIIKVKISDASELDALLDAAAYEKFCENE